MNTDRRPSRHNLFFIALVLACFAVPSTMKAPPPPRPTATPTPTPGPASARFLHIVYDWSAQGTASYLGGATTFLGTTIAGPIVIPSGGVLPPNTGTLYFINNRPALNQPAFGSASIDVQVGAAEQAGKWSGSVQITCAADWSPKYPAGSTATLTVTSFDSTTAVQTATKTITPGLLYNPVPSTIVATVTYSSAGTFTLN
jgi:hypothetical protein